MKRLLKILKYKRPHMSSSEAECIKTIITDKYQHYLLEDNIIIVTDPTSKTLFSCHTDTVHSTSGEQIVHYNKNQNILFKADTEPLGADNGAGIWLLLEMIDANIPGTYVFHRGEERGGVGATTLANLHPEFLQQFDRAIAFDRRGSTSVITHQGGSRCCSEGFAKALCDQFKTVGLYMECDPTGIFTDTAMYTHLIPECTNISCGYDHEHSAAESLDLTYLQKLRAACLSINWEALPTVRKTGFDDDDDDGDGYYWRNARFSYQKLTWRSLVNMSPEEIYDFCENNPISTAEFLMEIVEEINTF